MLEFVENYMQLPFKVPQGKMAMIDFFTEKKTSVITDSHTRGGMPVNTSEAA